MQKAGITWPTELLLAGIAIGAGKLTAQYGANFNSSLKEVLDLTVPLALGDGERMFLT